MNGIIYLFGSGAAFFVGVALILVGVLLASLDSARRMGSLVLIAVLVGLALFVLSATPLPFWFGFLSVGVTLAWLLAEGLTSGWLSGRRVMLRLAVPVVWLAGVALELPYHRIPMLPAIAPPLYLIGDSISAGMGEHEDTWPRLLTRTRSIEVHDFSRMGATTAAAMRQAERLPESSGTVLVEIGGNDLLGATPASKFEADLDRLLQRICRPGRVVVMFELPLLPLCGDYGRAQRQLATRYGVRLIPKRVLVSVLTGDEATLDSIHLSPAGHEKMAEVIWRLVGPAYANRLSTQQ